MDFKILEEILKSIFHIENTLWEYINSKNRRGVETRWIFVD